MIFVSSNVGNSVLASSEPIPATTNSLGITSTKNLVLPINISSSVSGIVNVALGVKVNVQANVQANLNVDSGTMYVTFTSDRPIQVSFNAETTSSASFPAGNTLVSNYIVINNNDSNAHVTVTIAMSYANVAAKLNATIQSKLRLYYAEASATTFTQVSNSDVITSKMMVNVTVNHFSTWAIGYGPSSSTSTPAAPVLVIVAAFPLLVLYK